MKNDNNLKKEENFINFPQQGETQLKWLLDPLPVDSRVVVSVDRDTCPVPWQSWPTLYLTELSNKSVKVRKHIVL